jgi:molecular chaperone DnaJ
MHDSNHYQTLQINNNATAAEIKKAYRRLVKMFHPDSNQDTADHEEIIKINAAYEVLSDVEQRVKYDEQIGNWETSHPRAGNRENPRQTKKPGGKETDEKVEEWLKLVYQPINRWLCSMVSSLEQQLEDLAADPFDEQLIDEFQEYLDTCRDKLKKAQSAFRSLPNPPSLATSAAHLYYALNQVNDGLEELAYFPLSYDDRYLHTGKEMFRIAEQQLLPRFKHQGEVKNKSKN